MKTLVCLFWMTIPIVFVTTTHAQGVIDELPQNEAGQIVYSGVVAVDSTSISDLFIAARLFITDSFKSSNAVIQFEDKEAGIIAGKGYSMVVLQSAFGDMTVEMWFTLKIQCREGRFKYEIYDIYFSGYPEVSGVKVPDQPAEKIFSKEEYYNKKGEPKDSGLRYKNAMVPTIEALIETLKLQMTKLADNGNGEDDW